MYWEEKKGRICWGGGADEEKQENKSVPRRLLGQIPKITNSQTIKVYK